MKQEKPKNRARTTARRASPARRGAGHGSGDSCQGDTGGRRSSGCSTASSSFPRLLPPAPAGDREPPGVPTQAQAAARVAAAPPAFACAARCPQPVSPRGAGCFCPLLLAARCLAVEAACPLGSARLAKPRRLLLTRVSTYNKRLCVCSFFLLFPSPFLAFPAPRGFRPNRPKSLSELAYRVSNSAGT